MPIKEEEFKFQRALFANPPPPKGYHIVLVYNKDQTHHREFHMAIDAADKLFRGKPKVYVKGHVNSRGHVHHKGVHLDRHW